MQVTARTVLSRDSKNSISKRYYNTLQHTTSHCNMLLSVFPSNLLQGLWTPPCNTPQCTATSCNAALQRTAMHCSARQHITTQCNTLLSVFLYAVCKSYEAMTSTLQHTVMHCNALQRNTPHCNVLQHAVVCVSLGIIIKGHDLHTATNSNATKRTATHSNAHTATH